MQNQENPRETRETRAEEIETERRSPWKKEVIAALIRMKKGEAPGPNGIPE